MKTKVIIQASLLIVLGSILTSTFNTHSIGAKTPVGPWSEPQLLYTPPELNLNGNYWAYAIKGHYPYFAKLILANPSELTRELLESKLLYTENFIQKVSSMLDEAEAKGFYVLEERKSLDKAELLLESAKLDLANGALDECYADLQEAYLIASDVEDRASHIYVAGNTFVMIPFLAMNALAIAFLLFDNESIKIISFLSIFAALLVVISFVYVGFRDVNPKLILVECLLCVAACLLLPRLLREGKGNRARLSFVGALVAAFSIAKRNLRRRRLRTLLAIISLLTLVFAFVSLTSFRLGHGFTADVVPGAAPSQGILIRKPAALTQFQPLNDSIMEWLSHREETELVVPKAENVPSLFPVLTLSSPNGNKLAIQGAIGVVPSAESRTTFLNKTIKRGSFLSDNDSDGVLLSDVTAEKLGVNLGDSIEIAGNQFRLVGTFDSRLLKNTHDLDGASILPKKQVVRMAGITWSYCDPNEVAVFTFSSAMKLPSMALARVNVFTKNTSDISPLARLIVLDWGLDAWTSASHQVLHYYVGRYFEAKFSSLIVPFLLVIANISSLMTSCVYERKKEIHIMSTLGLNPTHLALIFMAEGIILGLTAGGIGYVLGLGSYRIMSLLPFQAEVTQKVSIEWSFLAVSFSILTAVLGTVIPAWRASILTTPSLTRRWNLSETVEKTDKYWKINLPIHVSDREVDSFSKYLFTELQTFETMIYRRLDNLRYEEKMKEDRITERRISFTFVGCPDENPERRIVADIEILIIPDEKREIWTSYVLYHGSKFKQKNRFSREESHALVSIVRGIILKWNNLPLDERLKIEPD